MNELKVLFESKYPGLKMKYVKSPLRVCPLGAHIDHQYGMVTGFALQESVDMAYCENIDGYVRVQSLDFPDEDYFHVEQVPGMIPGFWGNYVRGAVATLGKSFKLKKGMNAFISGKIPIGGLSSSAAVITAYLMALCDVNGIVMSKEELIEYSHWVEIKFIGLNNGILDQSANILSKDGYLMFMDCKTGKYELIEKAETMPDFEVVVVYSGLSKALIGTDYNNRVNECKVSAWILQEVACTSIDTLENVKLRDITHDIFNKYKDELPGRFRRRAEHFYSENERVLKSVQAWKEGDIEAFGRLMLQSGESSIYNYECGCPELISIYNILRECPGVYGARFSGAGYRGCCIGIVDPAFKDQIKKRIDKEYPLKHPEHKDLYRVYFCRTGDGARILDDVDTYNL